MTAGMEKKARTCRHALLERGNAKGEGMRRKETEKEKTVTVRI
jgi:hypothetical protein